MVSAGMQRPGVDKSAVANDPTSVLARNGLCDMNTKRRHLLQSCLLNVAN